MISLTNGIAQVRSAIARGMRQTTHEKITRT